jgi:hypothetical protein
MDNDLLTGCHPLLILIVPPNGDETRCFLKPSPRPVKERRFRFIADPLPGAGRTLASSSKAATQAHVCGNSGDGLFLIARLEIKRALRGSRSSKPMAWFAG